MKHGRPIKDANLHLLSCDIVAKMLNVSPRSVASASVVLDKADPAVIKALDRGDLAVSRAVEIIGLPAEDQQGRAALSPDDMPPSTGSR